MHSHSQKAARSHADIIAVDGDPSRSIKALENVQWVIERDQGRRELCQGQASVPGPGTALRFFIQSVLDFGCAVGIMRQSRSLVGTGVGSSGLVAESRKEGYERTGAL